jgi:hypothetical protein
VGPVRGAPTLDILDDHSTDTEDKRGVEMMRRAPRGPLVADATRGRIFLERGILPENTPERTALIAQFSLSPRQPRSLSEYVDQLAQSGFLPIIISTCESAAPLEFPYGLDSSTVIVRRPNSGYDFGSWATALGMIPQVRESNVVLLTNDSLLGPFEPINNLLEWISAPGPDIRALTSSYQFVRHMQSYFLAFRGGILQDQPWMDFFNSIRIETDKSAVVMKYELGVSQLAFREAYSTQEYASGPELGVPNENPTVDGWRNMVEWGIPFVKRTMLTHASTQKEAFEVREFIRRRFNTNIDEW